MNIKDMLADGSAFAIDMTSEETFKASLSQAAEAAIQMVGPRKALESCMMAQHLDLNDLFQTIRTVADHQSGKTRFLPMTVDFMNHFNRCVATTGLVAEMMSQNILDAENTKPLAN